VGATGSAEANAKYFYSEYRGASAHYFVGHNGEVWQIVRESDIAWHCGADRYKHKECRNDNSIGIELCCKMRNGSWYFEDATEKAAAELVKELMAKYNIPAANVIRHYDVTGKVCPAPYVNDAAKWQAFKNMLVKDEKPMIKVDNTPDAYAKDAVEWAIKNKILKGTEQGDYKLHSNVTRQELLVFLHRALK
jgi:N-acetylmuramoyl-L-alanine amidase CwlA